MKQPRARLLVFNDPRSMRIDSALAKEIGFEDSIVLLQLEYLIGISQHEHDGRLWTFQSLRNLNKEQFPWWSPATLGRILKRLEKRELIVIGNFNKTEWDKTQWFALNEAGIAQLKSVCLAPAPFQIETPPVSKRNIDVSKMKHRYDQNETTIPKTTPETTQSGGVAKASQTTPPPQGQRESDEALKQYGYDAGQRRKIYAARLPLTDQEIADLPEYIAALKRAGKRNPIGIVYNELIDGKSIPHPDDVAPTEAPLEYIYTDDGRAIPKDPERHARIQAQRKAQLAAAGYR
jgi:DNA-binding PadR family transcriptional regulator